jgi:xylan 1,4-beta-xylosidase
MIRKGNSILRGGSLMLLSCFSRLWSVGLRGVGRLVRVACRNRWMGWLVLAAVATLAEMVGVAYSQVAAEAPSRPRTFANPINIDYRFQTRRPSRREAADPVIVMYEDEYYLFASATGGYWYSSDMIDWKLVTPGDRAFETYAPAAMVYDGAMYYAADGALFRTEDPKSGKWESLGRPFSGGDPALFVDDDGRVFLYYGLSYNGAISGRELDPKNGFRPLGQPFDCYRANSAEHGWERRGEDNLGVMSRGRLQDGPWFEGAWMTKHAGTYYLQYAAPGTEFSTYADGVYTSKSPRGPFTYAPYSPFSFKPTGFIPGSGHGATFADTKGHYWHVTTMRISVKHEWERRLGIFPVEFDADGQMRANTLFGDYPMLTPAERKDDGADLSPGWMLVSYGKRAEASSSVEGFEPEKAFDENVRTYWSARSNEPGEWLSVDLGKRCRIDAVQVNFAEHDATALGRTQELYHQYRLEWSNDGTAWTMLADRSGNRADVPHDYLPLAEPVTAQYVRITNVHMAGGGPLSIRDLRLFGSGGGSAPAKAPSFEVQRDASDARNAVVRWELLGDAEGYVVRYGISENKLYENREVRGQKEIDLHDLNVGVDYYFTVDAFNESGRTLGTPQRAR